MKKNALILFLILISCSSFAQWSQISSPYSGNLWSICFPNSTVGYSGGNTAILNTADGGASWLSTNVSVFSINDITFPTYDTGYYVANNAIVGKSVNHGQTWTTSSLTAVSPYAILAVHFVNGMLGYIGTSGAQVLKTINGGIGWTSQSPSLGTSHVNSIHFLDAQNGVLVAELGKIRVTTNAGGTWSSASSGTTSNLYDLYFVNSTTGFICGASGVILKSTTGGANWSALTSGTTQYLYSICFRDALDGYAGGAHGTLLHTTDGGMNWTSVASTTIEDINDIAYNNGRYIGVCGAGKIITDLATGIDSPEQNVHAVIFPNPSGTEVHFTLGIKYREAIIKLFDLRGKEILHSKFANAEPISVSTLGIASGTYVYTILIDGDSFTTGKCVIE